MEIQSTAKWLSLTRLFASRLLVLAFGLFAACVASAAQLSLTVWGVGPGGVVTGEPIGSYRWTVEQDVSKVSTPGRPADKSNYSFSFHQSYMPVVAAGRAGDAALDFSDARKADPDVQRLADAVLPDLDPSKRYFVNIAAQGYQMGAAPVVFKDGVPTATVYLNKYPLPTAQISVFAFQDNYPINAAADLPEETGLAGFTVQLAEAGGTFGQSGGAVTQDAFANPLGTTYYADGSVKQRGNGIILTGADGTVVIKNLFPAKYTIFVVPPVGSDWHQTSTIEGTKGVDAWVKNDEPSFFQEFGPPGHHVSYGFVHSGKLKDAQGNTLLNGSNTLTGKVINIHNSRTPNYEFAKGAPVNDCWVGLNEPGGNGRALYAGACNKDSTFSIPNVPAGTYDLVVWDEPLDMIIGTTTITVPAGNSQTVALGDVPVFSWFGRYQGRVFQDIDGTGLPMFEADFSRPYIAVDPVTGLESPGTKTYKAGDLKPPFGEGIANNIRFRDGSIYQSATTKKDGTFAFTEVFPFFNWMVAEIDYARFKATGATMVVDGGGVIDPVANKTKLWPAEPGLFGTNDPALKYDPWIRLNPQQQADGKFYRNENCEGGGCAILLEGMQTFLGQTNHIEWGKQPYGFNENGGIAGIVHYAITRAEDDPRFATAENWEPGVPRVQVNLFLDCDGDTLPDQPANDGSGNCTLLSGANQYKYVQPDVDNYPFCWRDEEFANANPLLCPGGVAKGDEDIQRSGTLGSVFSYGDVFKWGAPGQSASAQLHTGLSKTDAWDDSVPEGCVKANAANPVGNGGITNPMTETLDCFDGLYNFQQLRPSVFDGGYAFGRVAGQEELPMVIGAGGNGTYIIEAVAPPGYLHQGNGDKNVTFGDELAVNPAWMPYECVGKELPVPAELSLFPGEANPNAEAGQLTWRKCDMKAVALNPGTNPAPDFYLFTEAPVSGHGVGFILDDTASEFNRFSPTFGEKYAPPYLPVSLQDWTGREISRVYSDQFGSYNFLTPSTFTINPPYPSGVMPAMMVSCMNHPGPVKIGVNEDGSDKMGIDPFFNRKYTQFCYTFQYLPGKTTYLDTPVLPIAAFAPVEKNPLDCECQDKTPAIYSVNNSDVNSNLGPWVPGSGGRLTLVSSGSQVQVPNPAHDPAVPTSPKQILRDYSFGPAHANNTVKLGSTVLTVVGAWNPDILVVEVPANTPSGQQLSITRGDNGRESVVGLTVHVGGPAPITVQPGTSIQAVIDAPTTKNGALITIPPGTYSEYLILDKRVRLQGWGADSVTINAGKQSAAGLNAWRALLNRKIDAQVGTVIDANTGELLLTPGPARSFDILPGQTLGTNVANNEPVFFGAEEGPGILAVGRLQRSGGVNGCVDSDKKFTIDGLTVTGSDSGGGILASGYTCNLQISNNRVTGNYGTYGGGVRVGHTALADGDSYTDGVNPSVSIHHNWIAENGASGSGGGGGVTMGTGASNYSINSNYVCGNFSMSNGGGISHFGRSDGGSIKSNQIIFNQSFNQSADPKGAGVFLGGQVSLGGDPVGTGDLTVDANVIQHNHAGAGAGGGISVALTITGDVIAISNNMIVNNVAAYAGGGVALDNAVGVALVNNTIADNASTATNRQSFSAATGPNNTNPQIAGVAVLTGASPSMLNNIIWGNKSYVWSIDRGVVPEQSKLELATSTGTGFAGPIWDLGRVAGTGALVPRYSVLTTAARNTAYANANCTQDSTTVVRCNTLVAADSTTLFAKPNAFDLATDPDQPGVLPETTIMQTALTFDEGGNFINVILSPLTLWDAADGVTLRSDYHLTLASAAMNKARARVGNNGVPGADFEGDLRPQLAYDIGADELALIRITPTTVSFGDQLRGTSAVRTVVLSNPQATDLALTSITLGSSGSANLNQFSQANTCGAVLAAGTSCTVTVTFAPTSTGSKVAQLILVNAAGTQTVAITGTSRVPQASLSPTVLPFGNQAVGSSSAVRQFTLSNTGFVPLTVNGIALTAGATQFTLGSNCPGVLPVAASCTVDVSFAPTSVGNKSGTVTVTLPGGATINNNGRVTLSGTGVQGALSIGGSSRNWLSTGGDRTFTLTNNGGSAVTLAAADPVVVGSDPVGQFTLVSTTCSNSQVLNSGNTGNSCTVTVNRVRPAATPRRGDGTLTITGSGMATPQVVFTLSGS